MARPQRWELHQRLRWWLIDRLVGRQPCVFNVRFDPQAATVSPQIDEREPLDG